MCPFPRMRIDGVSIRLRAAAPKPQNELDGVVFEIGSGTRRELEHLGTLVSGQRVIIYDPFVRRIYPALFHKILTPARYGMCSYQIEVRELAASLMEAA